MAHPVTRPPLRFLWDLSVSCDHLGQHLGDTQWQRTTGQVWDQRKAAWATTEIKSRSQTSPTVTMDLPVLTHLCRGLPTPCQLSP